MFAAAKEIYWELRKHPDEALEVLLQPVVPAYRVRRKYKSELRFWRNSIESLDDWFNKNCSSGWGLAPPRMDQKVKTSDLWITNAVMTRHRLFPHLVEELALEGVDVFRGKRILEVGCGPVVPILQFVDCERHGIDPLATQYIEAGWPIFDYDAKVISAFGEKMPYPEGYFDVVVSRNSLDHVDDFQQVAFEIVRVLKPGGSFVCQIEYHEPTLEEPQRLDDHAVATAFHRLEMHKLGERGKIELHRMIAARYNLSLEERLERDGVDKGQCYAIWHGRKPV